MARIRIISDGTPRGSRLLVDGVEVPNVVSVEWRCGSEHDATATAVVELLNVAIDAEAEAENEEAEAAAEAGGA